MKKLIALLTLLVASAPAEANFPKDTQNFPGYSLIEANPGFENGTTQWTASAGTLTASTPLRPAWVMADPIEAAVLDSVFPLAAGVH